MTKLSKSNEDSGEQSDARDQPYYRRHITIRGETPSSLSARDQRPNKRALNPRKRRSNLKEKLWMSITAVIPILTTFIFISEPITQSAKLVLVGVSIIPPSGVFLWDQSPGKDGGDNGRQGDAYQSFLSCPRHDLYAHSAPWVSKAKLPRTGLATYLA